jgi:dynein heavy chain, axonemal
VFASRVVHGDVLMSRLTLTSHASTQEDIDSFRFNRINIEVLSVVAQQIHAILTALSLKQKRFLFEGKEIPLLSQVGIFITMNPGYAGRTELPDNLTSMFRPVSMVVPDSIYIAENFLFSEGFQKTRVMLRTNTRLA